MADLVRNCRMLRLGTRGSQLARWQADWVAGELRKHGHSVELIEIATRGDIDQSRPVEEIGTRGVFTKAIQQALVNGDVDLAVHSLKDLPTEPVEGLVLAAVPQRESAADVLVSRNGLTLESLAPGALVGTGSLRRQAQVLHQRSNLRVADVRGNVETRLRKVLEDGQYAAIVLAEAGLKRLGLAQATWPVLSFDVMLPAVGQGALGIECRANDDTTLAAVRPLTHGDTFAAVTAERALLARLRGGCMAPVGALGRVEGALLRLQAVVLSSDGSRRLVVNESGAMREAEELGIRAAESLISQGAAELIAGSRAGG